MVVAPNCRYLVIQMKRMGIIVGSSVSHICTEGVTDFSLFPRVIRIIEMI